MKPIKRQLKRQYVWIELCSMLDNSEGIEISLSAENNEKSANNLHPCRNTSICTMFNLWKESSMGRTASILLQEGNVRGHLPWTPLSWQTAMPILQTCQGWSCKTCMSGKQNSTSNIPLLDNYLYKILNLHPLWNYMHSLLSIRWIFFYYFYERSKTR